MDRGEGNSKMRISIQLSKHKGSFGKGVEEINKRRPDNFLPKEWPFLLREKNQSEAKSEVVEGRSIMGINWVWIERKHFRLQSL